MSLISSMFAGGTKGVSGAAIKLADDDISDKREKAKLLMQQEFESSQRGLDRDARSKDARLDRESREKIASIEKPYNGRLWDTHTFIDPSTNETVSRLYNTRTGEYKNMPSGQIILPDEQGGEPDSTSQEEIKNQNARNASPGLVEMSLNPPAPTDLKGDDVSGQSPEQIQQTVDRMIFLELGDKNFDPTNQRHIRFMSAQHPEVFSEYRKKVSQ